MISTERAGFSGAMKRAALLTLGAIALVSLGACKLQYQSDRFDMEIRPDRSARLTLRLFDIGSRYQQASERRSDIDLMRSLVYGKKYAAKAAKAGVALDTREIEYENHISSINLEGRAKNYRAFFKALDELYRVEVKDGSIYIYPASQTILRAFARAPGEVIRADGKPIGFKWPTRTSSIFFTSEYALTGESFRGDFK